MKQIEGWWVNNPSKTVVETLLQKRNYHDDLIEYATSKCSEHRTYIDVGACYGLLSAQMSPFAKNVHAFEANPETFMCLKRNMITFSNVHLHNVGLSDKSGMRKLLYFDNDSRATYRQITYQKALQYKSTLKILPTFTRSLDSYNFTDVDLLKVDVEGHEEFVIKGALKTIIKYRPVIVIERKMGIRSSAYVDCALKMIGYEKQKVFRNKDYVYSC